MALEKCTHTHAERVREEREGRGRKQEADEPEKGNVANVPKNVNIF